MSDRNFWPSEAQFARLFIAVVGVAGPKNRTWTEISGYPGERKGERPRGRSVPGAAASSPASSKPPRRSIFQLSFLMSAAPTG